MKGTTILWQGLYRPGHEAAHLLHLDDGHHIEGMAVFTHNQQPCCLRYQITCGKAWQTQQVLVSGWMGHKTVEQEIVADETSRWWLNGEEVHAVQGCIDIDLNFSPVTNILPIRRCNLAVGEDAIVNAAWLRFPSFELEPLDQVYKRTGRLRYLYTSASGSYMAELTVNEHGFVTDYPDLWHVSK